MCHYLAIYFISVFLGYLCKLISFSKKKRKKKEVIFVNFLFLFLYTFQGKGLGSNPIFYILYSARLSISYRTGRYGQNIPYRPAIRYVRPPCFVSEKIPAVPANFGQYWPVQKKVFFFFFF